MSIDWEEEREKSDREARVFTRFAIGSAVLLVLLMIWSVWTKPTSTERFDACMDLADRGGLLPERREEAALICLDRATQRRQTSDPTPVVIPTGTGTVLGIP